MKFKITLPTQDIKPEIIEKRHKRMFVEDLERNGLLAKTFIFVYLNQPISVTDLTKRLNDYYQVDYDRGLIFRSLKKLSDQYLLAKASIGYVITISDIDKREIHKKVIERYHAFLQTIPKPFRNNYQDVNYFWVQNGEGLKHIEWCCKLLNFKVDVEEDKDDRENTKAN